MIIEHVHKLAGLRESVALEAFAGMVGKRAYEQYGENKDGSRSTSANNSAAAGCRSESHMSRDTPKGSPAGGGCILQALFDAVVAFHRASSAADFVRNELYQLLPKLPSRSTKSDEISNENTDVKKQSEHGDISDQTALPTHEFMLMVKNDLKAGSSVSFSVGEGVHAMFYLDCQLETREMFKGWYGVYLCPDWPTISNDVYLQYENLPALVSFRLCMKSKNIDWEYLSNPIVFHTNDNGWGQCRAVRDEILRKNKSAVLSCFARSSAVFRMCLAHLYRNFDTIDPEILSGLDSRTFRSLICSRWPGRKGGLCSKRVASLCERLSKKSVEWSSLRQRTQMLQDQVVKLRKSLDQEREGNRNCDKHDNREGAADLEEKEPLPFGVLENNASRSVIKLPWGIAYVPRQSQSLPALPPLPTPSRSLKNPNDNNPNQSPRNVRLITSSLLSPRKKSKRATVRSLDDSEVDNESDDEDTTEGLRGYGLTRVDEGKEKSQGAKRVTTY
ncbi:hypothetical protein AAMO2058_000105200 [Amorphochlora amoebiformis]